MYTLYIYTVYITLKQAAEAIGLSETTIRRFCKKKESKPFIKLVKANNGYAYTFQSNYRFDKYPPAKTPQKEDYTSIDNHAQGQPIHDYAAVWEAKKETIKILKDLLAYLKEENINLREENRDLKLLPAHYESLKQEKQERISFWKRVFG